MKFKARNVLLILAIALLCVLFVPTKAQAETYGNLTYSISNNTVIIADCKAFAAGKLTIPDTIDGYPVVAIGAGAFKKCVSITQITLPDTVTSIGAEAFMGCSSLKSITFGSGLKTVDDYAFSGCKKLTTLSFPEGVTRLGHFLLQDCEAVTDVSIPDTIEFVGESAFASCTALNTNTYDNAKYLGSEKNPYALLFSANSTSITSCNIHENTRVINDMAFQNCASLTKIVIPNGVKTLGCYSFYGCSKLKDVTLSENITYMGMYAFARCSSLPSMVVPSGVNYIHLSTFEGCTALASVTIPDGVVEIGQTAFFDCDSLTEIRMPDSVQIINLYAFSNCDKLAKVHLSGHLTAIHIGAFHESPAIREVSYNSIPEHWASIKIFADNENLTSQNIQFSSQCAHEFGYWKKADEHTHSRACPFCNAVETVDHNWGEPLIKKPATDEEDGILVYRCETCRFEKEEAYSNTLTFADIWEMIVNFFMQLLATLGLK